MADVTEYTTKENDRWDLIAYRAFGSCDKDEVKKICALNPDVPVTVLLPAGIKLFVPILEATEIDTALLPPWKQ